MKVRRPDASLRPEIRGPRPPGQGSRQIAQGRGLRRVGGWARSRAFLPSLPSLLVQPTSRTFR